MENSPGSRINAKVKSNARLPRQGADEAEHRRLEKIGLQKVYNASNPFPWMSEILDLKQEKNFFESRVTELVGKSKAFSNTSSPPSRQPSLGLPPIPPGFSASMSSQQAEIPV